ncbi:MAG TPA: hypothetical protein VHL31_23620 [Geminicoccus sp.]|uniref:hypothetical protein n=1 Tax=Geminicoccus sp. TaxID=2024832 RepID=UPI002E3801FE|nr:hypothetical protein [Geminicoccus sp.]HEX2529272.1 hypothetical protein [Geminicoccus sp.]
MLDRRRFIAGSASLATLASSGVGAAVLSAAIGGSHPAAAQRAFRLFDTMRFDGKPDDLSVCGLEPLRTVYVGDFWPGRDRDKPDFGHIEDVLVPKLAKHNYERLVLDIEHWEADQVDDLVEIVNLMRKLMPGTRFGYYSLVPVRDYWAFQPGKEGRLIVYAEQNRRWSKLADAVDDLYPTLYAFYKDREGWVRMADGTVAAAKAIGKPIYPYLWPQYHDKNKKIAREIIEGDFWLQQLDKVYDLGCDGAVIWGSLAGGRTPDGKIARLPWDPDAPWWVQTQAFAREKDIAKAGCR